MDSVATEARELSPEEVVQTVFDLVEADRFAEVAAYVVPDQLEELRWATIRTCDDNANHPRMTAEEYRRHDPDLPPAVAEYYASREVGRPPGETISDSFAGVGSVEELKSLSPPQLMEAWLKARDIRFVLARHAERLGVTVPPETLSPDRARVLLGVVRDGDRAHAVFRLSGDDDDAPVKVVSLVRTPAGWRMRMDHDFLGEFHYGFSFHAQLVDLVDGEPEA